MPAERGSPPRTARNLPAHLAVCDDDTCSPRAGLRAIVRRALARAAEGEMESLVVAALAMQFGPEVRRGKVRIAELPVRPTLKQRTAATVTNAGADAPSLSARRRRSAAQSTFRITKPQGVPPGRSTQFPTIPPVCADGQGSGSVSARTTITAIRTACVARPAMVHAATSP